MILAVLRLDTGDEIPVVVRDVSAGGAKIAVSHRHRLPTCFELVFKTTGRSMRVRLAWQRGNFAGVSIHGVRGELTGVRIS
ncbi:hypothetical protein OPKNFCMD_1029 [Methylobacterium crusticola]|uniref:PilZ domain-containing protein n=2 Tax=Methylobacterium crusticola TaxID=1697972 RepID=A0ABQ4QSL7_9HYPH|nr:hypothetical protein OPKNFCMD_1029 [Methylobacterium crusticola]